VLSDAELMKPSPSVHKKKETDHKNEPRKIKYEHFYKADENLASEVSFKILYDMRNIPTLGQLVNKFGLLKFAKRPMPIEKITKYLQEDLTKFSKSINPESND